MQPRRPITVVLSRFEDLVARGLRAFVEDDGALNLSAADVDAADLDRTLTDIRPSVALLNFGSLRSAADLHRLSTTHPTTRFLVLANHPTLAEANQLLAFGASACLSKETQARDILSAIHLAHRGLQVLPRTDASGDGTAPGAGAGAAHHAGETSGPELLTPREADVLGLLQAGESNAEIARSLHVGVETVRTHRRNIYRKLGVRTRRELATLAIRRSA
ncbi:Transcriptional regulatory protein LnrK [Paraconexibacter sp. AEG42_29]|uniref:Transcriptional regulatory protein LnrK n=1 Tax=Paraconexibacter sp. AEG42_29 TaxID=2997339 RepID=A0AAU7B0K5_9ACTN